MVLIKRRKEIPASEITSESVWRSRRSFLGVTGMMAATIAVPALSAGAGGRKIYRETGEVIAAPDWLKEKLHDVNPGDYSTTENPTPWEYVTQYNNFYEFGTDKEDPSDNAGDFRTDPWAVTIDGEADVTGTFTLEDILKPHDLEERIYRLRCVEAWSMVIPWTGFPLADLIKRFRPNSNARYVRFETLFDPKQMPGQRSRFTSISYPYVEGLRIDEAVNELSFMAVGVYGNALPPQNGAPLRLVVPWKYGFKSIKSIVRISFLRNRPRTTWEKANSREYGFYANVNPEVDHPRWSQASERRLPSSLFSPNRRETLMFNGYGEQVAHLYAGMDLKRNF